MSEERYGFNLGDVLLHDLTLPIGGAPSHYIFISAFCCSTLLARLLDRVLGCFVLREPSILGQLAMMRYRRSPALVPQQKPAITDRRYNRRTMPRGMNIRRLSFPRKRESTTGPASAEVTGAENWEED